MIPYQSGLLYGKDRQYKWLVVFTQDDLNSTTLDVGKLSEVPEITKVLICFVIISRLVVYRRQITCQ